jgi:hypothetical protein
MYTPNRLTPIQWLICAIAAIGFAFDTYELLMFPLINRPALTQLGGLEFGTPEYRRWLGLLFYVPAVSACSVVILPIAPAAAAS